MPHMTPSNDNWPIILIATLILGSLAIWLGNHSKEKAVEKITAGKEKNHLSDLRQSFFQGGGSGLHEVIEFTTSRGDYCVEGERGLVCDFKGNK